MNPIASINVASVQASTEPISVLRVRGNFRGSTADRWLMLFNNRQAAANGDTPIVAAIPLYQTAPFFAEFEIGALWFSMGCYAAVSTTQSTLTLSTDTMDITLECDAPSLPDSTTFVGDLTTAVTGLQVWSEANGTTTRQKVITLEVDGTNLTTATQFIQIHAKDTVATGDAAIVSIPIAVGGVKTGENALRFGEGLHPFSKDTVAPYTNRYGCTVKISSTSPTFTAPTGTAAIRAEIRNV